MPESETASVDREQHIDFILDHSRSRVTTGRLTTPRLSQKGGNPGCGDVVAFYLRLSQDGRIEDITFEGEGCTISQAGSSIVTEMFHGKTLQDVEDTPADAILDVLGREIAAARLKCGACSG